MKRNIQGTNCFFQLTLAEIKQPILADTVTKVRYHPHPQPSTTFKLAPNPKKRNWNISCYSSLSLVEMKISWLQEFKEFPHRGWTTFRPKINKIETSSHFILIFVEMQLPIRKDIPITRIYTVSLLQY